jgi:hypothetical protein
VATKRKPANPPLVNTKALLDDMLPDDTQEDLYTFIEEVGPNISTVDIFRLNKDGSRPHVDRVTLDAIKEDVYGYLHGIGAGKYLLQFKSADRMIRRTKVIEVAGPTGVVPGTAAPAAGQEHVQFLREQMAQQQTLLLALIGNLGKGGGPDLSFLSGVLKPPDMTPVVTLMTAMLGRKDDGGGLAMAKTIVELSRDLAPDGGREESWLSVAKDVGGRVVDTIGVALRQPSATQPMLPPAAVVVPPAPPRPANGATISKNGSPLVTRENFADYIRQGLAYLKEKARVNKDVEVIADFVVENHDEPQWTAILGAIEQGATFENLLQFDPEIATTANLRAWFQSFYDELHDAIFNPVDSAGAARDAANPGNNAGAGAEGPKQPGDTPGS